MNTPKSTKIPEEVRGRVLQLIPAPRNMEFNFYSSRIPIATGRLFQFSGCGSGKASREQTLPRGTPVKKPDQRLSHRDMFKRQGRVINQRERFKLLRGVRLNKRFDVWMNYRYGIEAKKNI